MDTAAGWLSFHIFYHAGDRDRLLLDVVRPVVRHLWRERQVTSFFFLRYLSGGPHIRLRLQPAAGQETAVREAVRRRAAEFLAAHPSPAPLPKETIAPATPHPPWPGAGEGDDARFADNTVEEIAFEPETARYGGPELLAKSLHFFALSSVRALQLLGLPEATRRSRRLAMAARLLLDYALGFARSPMELKGLLGASQRGTGRASDLLRAKGDQAFSLHGDRYARLARQGIDALTPASSPLADSAAARRLDREIRAADAAARAQILVSQLHLAANRLGLSNFEEVYLARILVRALAAVEQAESATWSGLGERLTAHAAAGAAADGRLEDLLAPALSSL